MSRELDAEVAEKVMGWKLADRKAMRWGDGPPVWITGDEANPSHQDFRPSTDPAAAHLVIDAMRAKGYSVDIDDFTAKPPNVWSVRFFKGDIADPDEYGSAEAPTFAEAVCRAALRSMEEKC